MAAHSPEQCVHRRGLLTEEIPSVVVRGRCLRDLAVGLRLDGMDKIWELDRVLDEENGNVVAYNVCLPVSSPYGNTSILYKLTKVALVCVETNGKTMNIAHGVG